MIVKNRILLFLFLCIYSASLPAQSPTPQWRPVYHFTPEKNWTNDPNGLIYINGVYHLYNQQNPFENKWGHMSWGHSTSTDLIHWKHLPIAIPETIDKDTTWRFSGSAVLDKNNSSGFCKNKNCIVAIYTADQPNLKKESQFVACSNDGGITFTNYKNNPVLDLHMKDFRDPNVFWMKKTKQWIMTVSLPNEHKVRFYGSIDLKTWNMLSEFGPEGSVNGIWECPFLIELPVDGNLNNQKWLLAVSFSSAQTGVHMQYFTGDFDGKKFTNDNPATKELTLDYGDSFYAAIPWNNLPDHQKTFIGWMVPGLTATYPWTGQMSIPRDLGFIKTREGLRLVQKPAMLIKNNLAKLSGNNLLEIKQLELNNREMQLTSEIVKNNSYWLEAELDTRDGATAGFKIAQKKDSNNNLIEETEIGYDASKNQVYIDKSHSVDSLKKNMARQIIDLKNDAGKIKLEILFDKSSLEIFVNGGEEVLSTYIYPGEGADLLSMFATGGKSLFEHIRIWDLSKINNKIAEN
jgi:levanase/fructan beta-fructosidase